MKRFDYIIGNPPYDGNLHLKILDAVKDYSNKLIWLSPVTELVDKRLKFMEPKNIMKRKHLYSHLFEMGEVYKSKQMKILFDGIESPVPVAIQVYDFNKENMNFSPDMYVEWINKDIEKPLLKKIFDKCKESNWENTDSNRGEFVIPTPIIHALGHVLRKNYQSSINSNSCGKRFCFNTEEERRNFHDAYFTEFMLWSISQWKINNHVDTGLKFIPWLGDYTKPWTNERLYDYFDLTPEEIEFVENEIKKMKL